MQHPSRYPDRGSNPNLVVAVLDHNSQLEKESFEKLVKANATIMMCDIRLLFIEADEEPENIKIKLTKFFKEASL